MTQDENASGKVADMKSRTKSAVVAAAVFALGSLIGGLTALVLGCGAGPGWLGAGLAIEALLDPTAQDGEDGADGLGGISCWDTNEDFGCQPAEDVDADGECTALDCQGEDSDVPGPAGEPGADSTVPGPQGPPGQAGPQIIIRPPPVVIIVPPPPVDPPDDEEPEDGPPYGRGPDGNGPPGQDKKP